MRLTVLGSADAFNSAGRGHSCCLLEGRGVGPLAVDLGATALQALHRLGRRGADIKGIAVTHLHGDHIGGFPYLIIDCMFHSLRREPLEVLGPVGSAEAISQLLTLAYPDVSAVRRSWDLSVRELSPGDEGDLAGLRVAAFAADHMDPPHQPLCLRITAPDGKVVAFSGDSAICDGLLAAARGADLLVAECSSLAPPCGRHTTWERWLQVLPDLDAKQVLLTHLGSRVRAEATALLQQVPAGVKLAFADDGQQWDI